MSPRNLFLLAGAALLIVGCNGGVTSPTSVRSGGPAASSKKPPTVPAASADSAASANECRSSYHVWAREGGGADSVCMDDIQ